MPGSSGQDLSHGFVRSALMLVACISVVALALLPVAWNFGGANGLGGLAVAAAVCLLAGLAAEAASIVLVRIGNPMAATLLSMGIRMLPPLVLCVGLALSGTNGREHLAFIVYLLGFYLATLVMETCLAVKRVAPSTPAPPRGLG